MVPTANRHPQHRYAIYTFNPILSVGRSAVCIACMLQPMLVSFSEQTQQYEAEIAKLEAEEAELVQHVNDCVGNRAQGVVCGLSATEARSRIRTLP